MSIIYLHSSDRGEDRAGEGCSPREAGPGAEAGGDHQGQHQHAHQEEGRPQQVRGGGAGRRARTPRPRWQHPRPALARPRQAEHRGAPPARAHRRLPAVDTVLVTWDTWLL